MDKMKNVCWVMVLVVVVSGSWVTAEGSEPIPGMVSYWTFDDGAGEVAHDAFGNNNGAVQGAEWTSGQIGGALEFDETGRVNCGHDSSLDMTGGMTICLWVNPDDSEGGSRRIVVMGTSGDSVGLRYRNNLNEVSYRVRHGQNDKVISAPAFPGVWQHVAATYDSGTMELYVDGEFAGQVTGADLRPAVSAYDFIIGGISGISPETWFDGKIDDVALFNRALTPDEIWQSYQDGLAGLGYELDQRQVAINKIERAIAEKREALELVNLAMERERVALDALNDLSAGGEPGELSLMDIFKAKVEIVWAMGRQIHAKFNLRRSIRKLERALRRLTLEPEPAEGPVRPDRPLGPRGRGR